MLPVSLCFGWLRVSRCQRYQLVAILSINLGVLIVPKYGILFYHWSVLSTLIRQSVQRHFNETVPSPLDVQSLCISDKKSFDIVTKNRMRHDDFKVIKVIGRGAFGEVQLVSWLFTAMLCDQCSPLSYLLGPCLC